MRLLRDQRGAAYVEFLLAFIPLFVLFLGMVQMALMYAGDLVVQHAASNATRAAVVVLDDDPQYYDGAARNRLDAPGTSGEDAVGSVLHLFGGSGSSTHSSSHGPRLTAIRTAASVPLLAISPTLEQLVDADSIRTAIDDPEQRAITGALVYNDAAMAVTFPTAPGATSYRSSFSRGDQVTARVTYLFHCGVPLVNRMMCETYGALRLGPAAEAVETVVRGLADGSLSFDDATQRLRRIDETRRRYNRDNPGINELDAAGSSELLYLSWGRGARFKVMRGEATMPLQAAQYDYASE